MQLMILDMGAQGPSARYPLGVAGKTSDILCLADNELAEETAARKS